MDFLFTSLCFEWLDLREELWETRKALKWTGFPATFPCQSVLRYSYGSIPIPFVGGMNIHLPAILMLGLPGFWPTGQRPLCASLGNRTRHSKRFPSASTKVMFSSSFGLSWQKMPPAVWAASTKRGKATKIEIRRVSSQHFRYYPHVVASFPWYFVGYLKSETL